MTDERARGVLLYSLAGIVLLGGGVWFLRTDPTRADPRIAIRLERAEQALPDVEGQIMAESVVLWAGRATEVNQPVDSGSYTLTMVCAGVGRARVRLSSTGDESGRGVACADESPVPDRISFGLADEFYLAVTPEGDDVERAVFRWRLERNRTF